ncbi:hypothetical protein [Pseudomonas sp. NBRC 111121]|uniref:hypothetical protein n=1 Tax=Pseudomonas sp. NBRC 111121 TaxID=1661036 RepID=UPI000761998B|nr:hypothetical protein [Pseudomonas sp. NBRC 111121]
MKNILNLYQENKSYIELFEILEVRLVEVVKSSIQSNNYIVIKKSLLNRLARRDSSLKKLPRVLTYAKNRSDVFKNTGTASEFLKPEVLSYLRKNIRLEEKYEYYNEDKHFPLFELSYRFVDDIEWFFQADQDDPHNFQRLDCVRYANHFLNDLYAYTHHYSIDSSEKINRHITDNNLYISHKRLKDQYLKLLEMTNLETHKAAKSLSREEFKDRVNSFMVNLVRGGELRNLTGVLLNIANLSGSELAKFHTGYYTRIPFFKNGMIPKRLLCVVPRIDHQLNGCIHLLIKGDAQLLHVVYEYCRFDRIIRFDSYDLNKPKTLKLLSYELEVSTECLSDGEIDLIEMMLYGEVDEFKDYTSFDYDHEAFMNLGMSGDNPNVYTEYLQDRAGLYHRWKR